MPSEVLWSPINIPDNDSDGIDGAIGIIIFYFVPNFDSLCFIFN